MWLVVALSGTWLLQVPLQGPPWGGNLLPGVLHHTPSGLVSNKVQLFLEIPALRVRLQPRNSGFAGNTEGGRSVRAEGTRQGYGHGFSELGGQALPSGPLWGG